MFLLQRFCGLFVQSSFVFQRLQVSRLLFVYRVLQLRIRLLPFLHFSPGRLNLILQCRNRKRLTLKTKQCFIIIFFSYTINIIGSRDQESMISFGVFGPAHLLCNGKKKVLNNIIIIDDYCFNTIYVN